MAKLFVNIFNLHDSDKYNYFVISIATLTISNLGVFKIYTIMCHTCKFLLLKHNAVIMIMCNLHNCIYYEFYMITCHNMYTKWL